jgi:NADPH:quinone reductase-like Zn-dependent oxidoreductase
VVAAVGFGASGFSVGDEVYGLTDWYRDGAAAERVAVEARNLAPRPRTIDHLAACTLPLAGLTAWQALFLHGRIDRGARVLVLGAGGGVGNLAAQVATGAGADVIGAGRARDQEAIVAAGARFAYLERDWLPTLAGITLVLDTVGGDPAAAAASRLDETARMVSIVDPRLVEPLSARGAFFVVEPDRETLSEIASWVDTGRLTPAPWRAWKLDDAADAIAAKERRQLAGKVAIQLTEL